MAKTLTKEQYGKKDLLRFLTCGSVDDGKSTLIGNLLYNSKLICKDQVEALRTDTKKHGTTEEDVDYALLMDGLASEREQGITIDVAYRYFETPKRKFIVADTPGHEQYTRNMITGASTADLAVVLVDASKGLLVQSKRHAFLVSLLRIPHVILAVNKMDIVDYSEQVYTKIVDDFKEFCLKLDIQSITPIPVSALKGDNVISLSMKTPWYKGDHFLGSLENAYVKSNKNLIDFRFPVQYVLRPDSSFRGFAGKIESGTITPGERIAILPSGKRSTVRSIVTYDGDLDEAFSPQSVVLTLEDELDISRGSMIVRENNLPRAGEEIDVMIAWMGDEDVEILDKKLILRHTTREVSAYVTKLNYTVDVNTLHRQKNVTELGLNDIARAQIKTSQPLFFDSYRANKATGSFILIDPITNNTVAAGMIRGKSTSLPEEGEGESIKSSNITKEDAPVTLELLEERNGHKGQIIWFTGLSGSGKSTIARELMRQLFEQGKQVTILDGDNLRHGLNRDLGFSESDRAENIRRVGEVAKLFAMNGVITLCSFISPYNKDRNSIRNNIEDGRFVEVYVKCDVEECKKRDPKGLYKKVDRGEIKNFTGIDAPYEEPENPEIVVETDKMSVEDAVEEILNYLTN